MELVGKGNGKIWMAQSGTKSCRGIKHTQRITKKTVLPSLEVKCGTRIVETKEIMFAPLEETNVKVQVSVLFSYILRVLLI